MQDEILEPLGPLHAIAEPDILEAFKSRVGAMKASGEYDRRFNQNKDRIARELEHPTPVAGLKKATEIRVWELSASVPETLPESLLRQAQSVPDRIARELEHPTPVAGLKKATEIRVWELSASVPETLPESLLRQAQSVPMPHLSRSLLFIDGKDAKSIGAAQKLYQSQKDMRVVLVNGTPAEVSEKLNRRVFFDQGGALVRVFGIKAVPALLFNGRVVLVNGTPAEVSEKLNRRVFFDQGGALVRVFGIKAVPALLFNGPEGPEGAEFAPDQLSELLSLMPQP